MKISKVLKLAVEGDKTKLAKYLQKGIFSKKDKNDAVKQIPFNTESNSKIQYLYIANAQKDEILSTLVNNCISIKFVDTSNNFTMIVPPTMFSNSTEEINMLNAIAIDLNTIYNIPQMNFHGTAYDLYELMTGGQFGEYYKTLPKLTKEEYYE